MSSAHEFMHAATRAAVRTWRAQKQLVLFGREGYAARSVIAKIRDEGEGAAYGGIKSQHWEEVYTRDGLDVQRALFDMTGPYGSMRATWEVNQLCRRPYYVPLDEQLEYLGVNKRNYFKYLFGTTCFLEGYLRKHRGPKTISNYFEAGKSSTGALTGPAG